MANSNFTLSKLSVDFYKFYDPATYPEIENKAQRPYMVLVVKIDGNTFALPFRTNIHHNNCYKFKKSGRKTTSTTGIDFTKAVILNKPDYIGLPATIDNDEYLELSKKYFFIIGKFKAYLRGYINFITNGGDQFAAKKYKYCTLKYFHKELGI